MAQQLAVKCLIDAYSDCVTRRDFKSMATLFTADAVWKVGPPFGLRLEGASIAQGLGAALADYEVLIQASLNSVIEMAGEVASARTTMYEMGRSPDGSFVQFGIYEDVAVLSGGEWRFAARTFHPLYRDDAPLPGTSFPLALGV